MIISVDFDNTLALGNSEYISTLRPNTELISRLRNLRNAVAPKIKIVTARGAKAGLPEEEKRRRYTGQLKAWLAKYGVPYDEISFNKEYANLYIDDQTIGPDADFSGVTTYFTGSKIVFTGKTVIKNSPTAPTEKNWYSVAEIHGIAAPAVLFANDECIITERIRQTRQVCAADIVKILTRFRRIKHIGAPYSTYLNNLPGPSLQFKNVAGRAWEIIDGLKQKQHRGTFFHGDLSTSNVIISGKSAYLIDPNYKHVFGSYLTDAGKAAFSFIAYNAQFAEAQKIADKFGTDVWHFAVSEGLRVCKYQPKYISIVNNIADIIE